MRWNTGLVLIVERENEVPELLRAALEHTDYVLLQAENGKAALGVLARLKSDIDLAIIDLDLPSDDGLVISLLGLCGQLKKTKIIVKTSRQDQPFLEQVNYFGVDAIVLKPITEDLLIKTIQATLSRCRNGSGGAPTGTAA